MKDFKDTLLMMKTEFPMRGNLGVNELPIQNNWYEGGLYEKVLAKNKGNDTFFLHDGPPYANGNIHVGHAFNKIVKDFLIRYKSMSGFYAPYLPGWDAHGLPIENALTKSSKVNRKELTISQFRSLCEKYAFEQIETQKKGFKRLGILGEWDNPYITITKDFEAEQIRAFGKMAKKGLIFKGLKPVYWSPSSETALAEAEIEYHDIKSPSIYVAFKVEDGKGLLEKDTELVIWTTTPWTMPANLAICLGPDLEYSIVATPDRKFVLAKELVKSVMETLEISEYKVLNEESPLIGKDLEGITYRHPLFDRVSPVILGDHVTLDAGTGLVHTAPGHGADDFIVGKKYGLEILCPVDSKGHLTKEAGEFEGLFFEKANKEISIKLDEKKALLKLTFITHSYPHDWRTKKPIIFRATPQWFASIKGFKDDILKAIAKVNWVPTWGEVRIANMFKDREDWCISRQRVWGVPIPVFYGEDGTPILEEETINHVADLFDEFGSNVWFEREAKDLLPEGFTHPSSPNAKFTKEMDIMDVWFDSGTSHHAALKKRYGVYPADVYLEGSDQYRGWFNSSISTGVALTNEAPYKTVISHGFSLDGQGRKMSKSLGNVIDPIDVCKEFGSDILRLWVASVDYQADFRLSKELIKQSSDSYRKIRNTFRFLLGNLNDFDPKTNMVEYDQLNEVDKFMMCKLNSLVKEVNSAFDKYEFAEVYRKVLNYMSNELSAFYLDFTKDILYIDSKDNHSRRCIQSVFYKTLKTLACLMTPIIPHTTDEVYKYIPGDKLESIYLEDMPKYQPSLESEELISKYSKLLSLRDDVLKVLEIARNEKIIGKSLVAHLQIKPTPEMKETIDNLSINLAQVFIVSKLEIVDELSKTEDSVLEETSSGQILVKLCQGHTCARCWQIVDELTEDGICKRCSEVVKNID